MPSITMTYDALNEDGTFSEGDTITGKVTLVSTKQFSVESLFVKAKGDAHVQWSSGGEHSHTYSATRRFFKEKQFLVPEVSDNNPHSDTLVPQGTSVYPFSIKIPLQSMPSSFRGPHGKIVYKLEAKLCRSWRMDSTAEKDILFVSKSIPDLQSLVSSRQVGSVNRVMGGFQRDKLQMDVIVDKRAYAPGETIIIVANVNNDTANEKVRPKYSLIQDVVYRAGNNVKCDNTVILKVVDDYIKPKSEMSFRCALQIPRELKLTIHNCDVLSVEYHVKVYLDIKFASDPEVKLPVVIYPSSIAPRPQPGVAAHPNPANAIGGPSSSDFPPPAVPIGFYPAASPSGSYGQPGAPPQYPAQPANMSYGNPEPQPSLYGSPFSSPSSVLHPPPPAAPTFPSPTAPACPPPAAPAYHPPTAPVYPPPPSAPESQPSSFSSPSFNTSPMAPAYNLLPSAPELNVDFLSQTNDAPPSYSILFPPSATDKSDTK